MLPDSGSTRWWNHKHKMKLVLLILGNYTGESNVTTDRKYPQLAGKIHRFFWKQK